MKKYEKPVLSVIDIQVRENLARDPFQGLVGATTTTATGSLSGGNDEAARTTYNLGLMGSQP